MHSFRPIFKHLIICQQEESDNTSMYTYLLSTHVVLMQNHKTVQIMRELVREINF